MPLSQFITVFASCDSLQFIFVFSNFIKFISVFSNSIVIFSLYLILILISWFLLIFYFIPLISLFFLALISTFQPFYSQFTIALTVKLELSSTHLSALSIACSILSSIIFSSSHRFHNVTSLFLYLSIIFLLFHCNYRLFFEISHFNHRIFDSPIILHIYYDNLHIIYGSILVMIE